MAFFFFFFNTKELETPMGVILFLMVQSTYMIQTKYLDFEGAWESKPPYLM